MPSSSWLAIASLHSSPPAASAFRSGRIANDSWYVPRFKPHADRTFSNLSGAWTMKRNAGSVLPSTTALRPTFRVIGVSRSSEASVLFSPSMAFAGLCARSPMVSPSCMHSASCVFVSSFADTAAPMVFVAWTRRLSRRRAFLARRLVSFRAFFSRFASSRDRSFSSIIPTASGSSSEPGSPPLSDRLLPTLPPRLDSALRNDLRKRGEPNPAMPPFPARGEVAFDPGRETSSSKSSPPPPISPSLRSSSPDMDPTDSASSSPSLRTRPRMRTASRPTPPPPRDSRGVADADELPE